MRKCVGKDLNDLNMLTSDVLVGKSEPHLLTPRPFLVMWPDHLAAQSQRCDLKIVWLTEKSFFVKLKIPGNHWLYVVANRA